jgi:hypothetical protein
MPLSPYADPDVFRKFLNEEITLDDYVQSLETRAKQRREDEEYAEEREHERVTEPSEKAVRSGSGA